MQTTFLQTSFISIIFTFFILIASKNALAINTTVTEADVFEWWDNGIITEGEAEDILVLVEEGNEEEACALAEIYAQEQCQETIKDSTTTLKKNNKQSKGISLTPHGFFSWKGRIDSTGHIVSHREELQIAFYYYTLRLGSQKLFSYKKNLYEAYFGEISTKEIHSQIPLDTLFGTAFSFPIQKFFVEGFLDTSITSQIQIGYKNKQFNTSVIYWNSNNISSGILQLHLSGLSIALWQQQNQNFPLIKIKIQYRENEIYSYDINSFFKVSWNTMAYIHGTETPRFARLSSSVLKNKLWISQNISLDISQLAHAKISGNANIAMPHNSDSLKARFKFTTEIGPPLIHAKLATTCLDAASRCNQGDWSIRVTSQHAETDAILFDMQAKTRHQKEKKTYAGFNAPYLEAGFSYLENREKKFRFAVISLKGNSFKEIILRNESEISSKNLKCKFIVDFKQNKYRSLRPEKASFTTKFNF